MKGNEHNLQSLCVKWFRIYYQSIADLLFAVPNGTIYGTNNHFAYNMYLKSEGVTNGVSDLILLYGNGIYNALCIEMKYGKNKQSEAQKRWQKLAESNGNKYVVVYTVREFQQTIIDYFNGKN